MDSVSVIKESGVIREKSNKLQYIELKSKVRNKTRTVRVDYDTPLFKMYKEVGGDIIESDSFINAIKVGNKEGHLLSRLYRKRFSILKFENWRDIRDFDYILMKPSKSDTIKAIVFNRHNISEVNLDNYKVVTKDTEYTLKDIIINVSMFGSVLLNTVDGFYTDTSIVSGTLIVMDEKMVALIDCGKTGEYFTDLNYTMLKSLWKCGGS